MTVFSELRLVCDCLIKDAIGLWMSSKLWLVPDSLDLCPLLLKVKDTGDSNCGDWWLESNVGTLFYFYFYFYWTWEKHSRPNELWPWAWSPWQHVRWTIERCAAKNSRKPLNVVQWKAGVPVKVLTFVSQTHLGDTRTVCGDLELWWRNKFRL